VNQRECREGGKEYLLMVEREERKVGRHMEHDLATKILGVDGVCPGGIVLRVEATPVLLPSL